MYWQILAGNGGHAGHKIVGTEWPKHNGTLT